MENNNQLAKISLGINLVLIIAVIFLFVKMPSGTASNEESDENDSLSTSVEVQNDGELTIAYYNGDSLNNTQFFMDLQKSMQESSTKAENRLINKQKEIEKWSARWNEKAQAGLLPNEQERYYKEAAEKEQELAMLQQTVQIEAAQEQEQLMLTMYSRVNLYAKSFAEKNNIDLLLQSQLGNNISYVGPSMDVTKQFINHVNQEYSETSMPADSDEAGE